MTNRELLGVSAGRVACWQLCGLHSAAVATGDEGPGRMTRAAADFSVSGGGAAVERGRRDGAERVGQERVDERAAGLEDHAARPFASVAWCPASRVTRL